MVRDDLERTPVDRRNYDALNAIAIAYFELNYRTQSQRGEGLGYLSQSQRTTKILAVPWRAYSEVDDGALRDAILDFFEDAGSGEKLGSAATAPRLVPLVQSLERKESDPQRSARIRSISEAVIERFETLRGSTRNQSGSNCESQWRSLVTIVPVPAAMCMAEVSVSVALADSWVDPMVSS